MLTLHRVQLERRRNLALVYQTSSNVVSKEPSSQIYIYIYISIDNITHTAHPFPCTFGSDSQLDFRDLLEQ